MQFLKDTDFKGILAPGVLNTLQGANTENLNEAEKLAISELDPLRGKFDVDAELAKTDQERSSVLVRILVHITAYYLYNSVPDDEIPQRITDNWKKELATIEKIASGKHGSTLSQVTDETGEAETIFRWGSNKKRAHQLRP